jgi:hypothetical protein
MTSHDMLIFWIVVLGRLLLPLLIPRWPLPGVVACLVLDGVDQTIFQRFTSLNLDGYQGYDKALDIYYLTIAYLSMMRNWAHLFAYKVGQFLFYYRLVGVVLFEYTGIREIMLIFPNTFEYFFIFYEAVRVRWNPVRMSRNLVIAAAAFIWIFIKLPQEYIIHVAQVDVTEWLNTNVFHVPADATWPEALAANPGLTALIVVVIVALVVGAWWVIRHKAPPADHRLALAADPELDVTTPTARQIVQARMAKVFDNTLVEKLVLITLVTAIFSQMLPDVQANFVQLVVRVGLVVIVNAAVSQWLARRGTSYASLVREFLVMLAVNAGIAAVLYVLISATGGAIDLQNTLFFLLLVTLIVTLYDRFHVIHEVRFAPTPVESA